MVARDLQQYITGQQDLIREILAAAGMEFNKEVFSIFFGSLTRDDIERLGEIISKKQHITCTPEEVSEVLSSQHLGLRIKLRVGAKNHDSGAERYVGEEEVSYCLSYEKISGCEHRQVVQGAIPICSLEGKIFSGVPESLNPESFDRKVAPEVDVHKYFESEQARTDVGIMRGFADYFAHGYGKDFLRRQVSLDSAIRIVRSAFPGDGHASVLFYFEANLIDRCSGKSVQLDAFEFNCCVNDVQHPDCLFKQGYSDGLVECIARHGPLDPSISNLYAKRVGISSTPEQL